jgi:hypothetical protein
VIPTQIPDRFLQYEESLYFGLNEISERNYLLQDQTRRPQKPIGPEGLEHLPELFPLQIDSSNKLLAVHLYQCDELTRRHLGPLNCSFVFDHAFYEQQLIAERELIEHHCLLLDQLQAISAETVVLYNTPIGGFQEAKIIYDPATDTLTGLNKHTDEVVGEQLTTAPLPDPQTVYTIDETPEIVTVDETGAYSTTRGPAPAI